MHNWLYSLKQSCVNEKSNRDDIENCRYIVDEKIDIGKACVKLPCNYRIVCYRNLYKMLICTFAVFL